MRPRGDRDADLEGAAAALEHGPDAEAGAGLDELPGDVGDPALGDLGVVDAAQPAGRRRATGGRRRRGRRGVSGRSATSTVVVGLVAIEPDERPAAAAGPSTGSSQACRGGITSSPGSHRGEVAVLGPPGPLQRRYQQPHGLQPAALGAVSHPAAIAPTRRDRYRPAPVVCGSRLATYRRITLVALVALCSIIVTGGAVRLTGSGLGLLATGPGASRSAFVAPLELHPMVEFVNRLVTGLVSVVDRPRRARRRCAASPAGATSRWLSLGLVAGVIGQIVLGALTVAFELAPPFVMGHFLLSLVLVANAVVLHERAAPRAPRRRRASTGRDPPAGACALVPALAVAVVAGTVVTGTGPHGGDEDARRFGFDDRVGDPDPQPRRARVHRRCCSSCSAARRARAAPRPRFQRRARQLLAVACAQAAVGWMQYFTDVPAAARRRAHPRRDAGVGGLLPRSCWRPAAACRRPRSDGACVLAVCGRRRAGARRRRRAGRGRPAHRRHRARPRTGRGSSSCGTTRSTS